MDLLSALGIDATFWNQLVIAILAFVVLVPVFKSFHGCYLERLKRTSGSEVTVQDIEKKIEVLQKDYSVLLAKQEAEIKQIFDQVLSEADMELKASEQKAMEQLRSKVRQAEKELEALLVELKSQESRLLKELEELAEKKLIGV